MPWPKGRSRSTETRTKISQALHGKQRMPLSFEHRRKISQWNQGRQHAPEVRLKISTAQRGRTANAITRKKMSASGARRVIRELGTFAFLDRLGRLWGFRSVWEVRFAQRLDRENLTWRYQPDCLLLSNGYSYVPDFWVQEWQTYIEVKGRRDPRVPAKVAHAIEDGHPILVLRREAIDTFEFAEKE